MARPGLPSCGGPWRVSERSVNFVRTTARRLTAGTLAAIGALHVAGRGSSFPFRTRDALADAVVGSAAVPSPAGVLRGRARAVPRERARRRRARRSAPACARSDAPASRPCSRSRGVAGLAGRTDLLSPGSTSPKFRRSTGRISRRCASRSRPGAATAGRR